MADAVLHATALTRAPGRHASPGPNGSFDAPPAVPRRAAALLVLAMAAGGDHREWPGGAEAERNVHLRVTWRR